MFVGGQQPRRFVLPRKNVFDAFAANGSHVHALERTRCTGNSRAKDATVASVAVSDTNNLPVLWLTTLVVSFT